MMEIMEAEANQECDDQVELIITNGQVHIWNVKDAEIIRRKYRIVGTLVGSLPRQANQYTMLGLPLRLLEEEVTLLLQKKYACLVNYEEMSIEPSMRIKEKFKEFRQNNYEEQVASAAYDRRRDIEMYANKILEGRRKKLLKMENSDAAIKNLTREKVIEDECKKLQKLPEQMQVIQSFIEHPFVSSLYPIEIEWRYPSTAHEELRYQVFSDMWHEGYFITTGAKFGGDFLVYAGDPLLFHASFIVKCVPDIKKVDVSDIVTCTRIGTATKKTLVLAELDSEKNVHYKSFQLMGDDGTE
ncbi:unnamed protein product, partial [Meganyctiphanes norvegica]